MAVDKYTGQTITKEGAELIKERRASKADLLAEMRKDREQAALDRHSHVGAELGRTIAELDDMAVTYKALAELSNALIIRGHQQASGTVASLARGVQRAAVEYHGKEAAQSLGDISQPEGKPVAQQELMQPTEGASPLQEAVEAMAATGVPLEAAERNIEAATQSFGKPQPMAPLTAADASPVTPLATFEDDEPELDLPGADEPAVSPEVEDSPRAIAARKRRAAKRAAQSN